LDEQKAQMDAKRVVRAQEDDDEAQYHQMQEDVRRARMIADRQKQVYARQEVKNVATTRLQQAKERTLRYDYLDNVVYTNPADESYFDQFGTSCR
jgi:hypothetical protein